MHGKPRELSAEDKALIAKFEKSSFNHIRAKLVADLKGLSDPMFEPDGANAKVVCTSIRNWLKDEAVTATPSQMAAKLYPWLFHARKDEGYSDKTRTFGNELITIINGFTTGCLDAMEKRELSSLNPDASVSISANTALNPNSADLVELRKQVNDLNKLLEDTKRDHEREKEKLLRQAEDAKRDHGRELEKLSATHEREIEKLNATHEREKHALETNTSRQKETLASNTREIDRLSHEVSEFSKLKEAHQRLQLDSETAKSKATELQQRLTLELESEKSKTKTLETAKDALIGQLKEDMSNQKLRIEKLEAELLQLRQTNLQVNLEIVTLKARAETAEAARDKSAAELDAIRSAKETIAVEKGRVDGKLEATEKTNQDLLARETAIVGKMLSIQEAQREAEAHVREAGQVIHRLMAAEPVAPTHEARIQVVEESFSDVSASGRKALGLDVSIRDLKLRKKAVKTHAPGHSAAQAAGQAGHFKVPAGNGVKASTHVSATENGTKISKIEEAKTPEEALDFLKPKIVGKEGISETRFNAILTISKFVTKHLTDKGVMKPDANSVLYKLLLEADKSLVSPDSNTIESVYLKLKAEQPVDLKEPFLNDYNEVLTALAVVEPSGEKLQSRTMHWALNNFFVKVAHIKEMVAHCGSIYKALSPPANGINTSTLDATNTTSNLNSAFGTN